MKSAGDTPDWQNLINVPAEMIDVDAQKDALDKLRRFAKTSKVKPRTNPGVRKKN